MSICRICCCFFGFFFGGFRASCTIYRWAAAENQRLEHPRERWPTPYGPDCSPATTRDTCRESSQRRREAQSFSLLPRRMARLDYPSPAVSRKIGRGNASVIIFRVVTARREQGSACLTHAPCGWESNDVGYTTLLPMVTRECGRMWSPNSV